MQNLWRTTITWKKSLKTWIEQKHEKFSQTFGNPQKYLERDEFLLVLNILKNFVREIAILRQYFQAKENFQAFTKKLKNY